MEKRKGKVGGAPSDNSVALADPRKREVYLFSGCEEEKKIFV